MRKKIQKCLNSLIKGYCYEVVRITVNTLEEFSLCADPHFHTRCDHSDFLNVTPTVFNISASPHRVHEGLGN